MEWSNLDFKKITRIDLSCPKCFKVQVKIKGEDLNCDFCGADLFALSEVSE